jgi:hypothetical protein
MTLLDSKTMQPPPAEEIAKLKTQDEPDILYLGIMLVPVGISDSSGKMLDVRPQEIRFVIDATSIDEAFSKYKANAEDTVAELKKKQNESMKQNNLVVPNAVETEAINNMKLVMPE